VCQPKNIKKIRKSEYSLDDRLTLPANLATATIIKLVRHDDYFARFFGFIHSVAPVHVNHRKVSVHIPDKLL
jgi:hypothetical protein